MATEERFIFLVDWFDQPADLVRKYQLTFFSADNTLEMYDNKNRRMFLKRCKNPNVGMDELFIGATISVYARQLKITEYGDVFTRKKFENKRGRTFAMVKPDCYIHIGKIVDIILSNGFKISQMQMAKLTPSQAGQLCSNPQEAQFLTSDVVVGFELVAEGAVEKLLGLIEPIRNQFGTDMVRNAVHGSADGPSAARELNFFFGGVSSEAQLTNCSCCVIKPHAIPQAGKIIDWILQEGYEISALTMYHLDRPTANEFFEVYKGVLPEFVPLVDHMTLGPCIALEIRQENAVQAFRELCGPIDPEIGRTLRPNTIRARFGFDRVQNAVHCTDLPEDGVLECEYFFNVMQGK